MKRFSAVFFIGLLLMCYGCKPPTFSPPEGTYCDDISVTLTAPSYDTIYYTTDGSNPTTSSSQYSGPIPVAGDGTEVTIKAYTVFSFLYSTVVSKTYTIDYNYSCDGDDNDGDGYTENNDCDDTDSDIHPGAVEICGDGVDQDCSGDDLSCDDVDNDSDGYTENQGDCDDGDSGINPGVAETCGDGIDQDCSGADLVCSEDTDDDGDGYTENQGDCNDGDSGIYPGAAETCGDGIDQDCSGDDLVCSEDIDDDGDGYTENQGDCDDEDSDINPDATETCGDGIDQDCSGSDLICPEDIDDDSDGYTENQGDCDDEDSDINPGAAEICGDGIDQDCSGSDLICPEDIDDDSDGYTENEGDCNDGDAGINPGASEICDDGIDQDCDGTDQDCASCNETLGFEDSSLPAGWTVGEIHDCGYGITSTQADHSGSQGFRAGGETEPWASDFDGTVALIRSYDSPTYIHSVTAWVKKDNLNQGDGYFRVDGVEFSGDLRGDYPNWTLRTWDINDDVSEIAFRYHSMWRTCCNATKIYLDDIQINYCAP